MLPKQTKSFVACVEWKVVTRSCTLEGASVNFSEEELAVSVKSCPAFCLELQC